MNYRQAISRNYTRQLYKHIHVVHHICSTFLLLLLISKILKGLDYDNTTLFHATILIVLSFTHGAPIKAKL